MPCMSMPQRCLAGANPKASRTRGACTCATILAFAGMVLFHVVTPVRQVAAADENPEAELEALRGRIEALHRHIDETRMHHDAVATRLRTTEIAVSRLRAEVAELDQRRHALGERLDSLERRRDEAVRDISVLRASLARYVRAAYATGRQDHFKLLLNQENPATVSRAMTYYAYFNRERARRIRALATDLEELADIRESIARDTAAIARLREQKTATRLSLESERAERRQAVERLKKELGTQGARLARLRQDEEKLAELVAGLARELGDIPRAVDHQVPFETLKGKLPWPTSGSLRARFGTPRGNGDLNWKGVLVAARPGTPVHAVSHGRVAFADWLRGFGLLMIIEHGDGYMSLYGHSESLMKEVGDWVDAGEVIGTVGDTGGRDSSGLYFEIRHRGTPVDPVRWCGRGPAAQSAALVSP